MFAICVHHKLFKAFCLNYLRKMRRYRKMFITAALLIAAKPFLLQTSSSTFENKRKQGKHGNIKVALKAWKQKGLFIAPAWASKYNNERKSPFQVRKKIVFKNEWVIELFLEFLHTCAHINTHITMSHQCCVNH